MGERLVLGIRDKEKIVWLYHHAGTKIAFVGLVAEARLSMNPQSADAWVVALRSLDERFEVIEDPEGSDKNYLGLVDVVEQKAVWFQLYQLWDIKDLDKEHAIKVSFVRLAERGFYDVIPLVVNFDYEVLDLKHPERLIYKWEKALDEVERAFKKKYGSVDYEFVREMLKEFGKERRLISEYKNKYRVF